MVTHNQYIRKASLLVGNDSSAIDLSELQYHFSIKLAEVATPQFAVFRIYNVSEETKNLIKAKEYSRVVFSAGYQQGNYGTIFDGEVIQGTSGRESPTDSYIELLAAVGYSAYQSGIRITLAAGCTALDAAKAAASAMGMTLNDHTKGSPAQMPRGKVLNGMASDVLTVAAKTLGATWFYNGNGGIDLVDGATPIQGDPLILNSTTGMIGWPEQTQDGIRVRCLLNPTVSVATTVLLNNRSVQQAAISSDIRFINTLPQLDADGLYRVLYYEHFGSTRDTPWYTDIICISAHQTADGGITNLYQRGLA